MINRIVQRISSQLKTFDRNTDQAVITAVAIMNEPISDLEKRDIAEFSKQLEPALCPNFKTIHDETTTSCIWTIAHWIIRSHLLITQITEMINQYGNTEYQLKTEFNDIWRMTLIRSDEPVASIQLDHRYGLPLIKEITDFIFQNITMPE